MILAASTILLTPKPAEAWWYHGPGWHRWGYARCCFGPRVYAGLPPVVVAPPRYYVAGPVWAPAHWNGPYWVGGHWR